MDVVAGVTAALRANFAAGAPNEIFIQKAVGIATILIHVMIVIRAAAVAEKLNLLAGYNFYAVV